MSDEEYRHVLGDLDRAGLRNDGQWGEMRLESGHFLALGQPGRHDDQWHVDIKHPGDPFGSWFHSRLGTDHTQVAGNLMREFRHPEVMNHMREQMARAELNDDPHGQGHNGGPGQYADTPSAIFSHYE